ncbi:hypothetical protein Tco_0513340 [Tanacetum coccineum]
MHVIKQPLPPAPELALNLTLWLSGQLNMMLILRFDCLLLGKANTQIVYAKGRIRLMARERKEEVGTHWKRNCPVYLAELQKKRKQVGSASSSGIFTIELFSFPNNNSWVYDTGCVEAIGSFDLVLPNGLVICLDNCHYAPTITRGVVSVSRLVDNGFVQCFTDCGISVSKNGVLYFNVVPRNGIYEIDMHDLVPNVNSIYNVSNKRVKHNLDSTYLWHCRLAHINKKRI